MGKTLLRTYGPFLALMCALALIVVVAPSKVTDKEAAGGPVLYVEPTAVGPTDSDTAGPLPTASTSSTSSGGTTPAGPSARSRAGTPRPR